MRDVVVEVFERRSRPELTAEPGAGLIEYRTVELLRSAGIAGMDLAGLDQRLRLSGRTRRVLPNRAAVGRRSFSG